uniref:Pectinesterase inhibitor domain-containing protein n=2 Tax=Aegilops tauschii TaxID=37682 RepID=A0A453QEQ1_AEGTS
MAISNTSIIFPIIVFVLLSTNIPTQASDSGSGNSKATNLMVEACKNASINSYIKTVPEEFCLSTLQSDIRSIKAKDLHDLVLIAMDITKGRLTSASGMVKKMLQNAKKGTVRMRVLRFCEVDYEEMASILNICDAMIRNYQGYKGNMRFQELASCVNDAYDPAGACEEELQDMPEEAALFKENTELQMLVWMGTNFLVPMVVP